MDKNVETITFEFDGHQVTVPVVRVCPADEHARYTFVSCPCGRDYIVTHPYSGPCFPAEVTCPFCGGHRWIGKAGCSGAIFNAMSGAPRLERLWRRPDPISYVDD